MTDDLKAKARRTWEEIFPACDVEGLADVVAPDAVEHGARPGEKQGFEGAKETMLWLGRVFSDQRWEIHQVIGEGDTVVVHATHHGRHTGDLMGLAPTGREVAYDYVHIVKFRDGKGAEHWGFRDQLTLMRQLGIGPGTGAETAETDSHSSPATVG
jgi:predicted ester cyclase